MSKLNNKMKIDIRIHSNVRADSAKKAEKQIKSGYVFHILASTR